MEYKKLSAGIVTYNNSKEILSCLSTMFEHGPDMDVYIYDNLSQDDTVELVNTQFPQVHVIEGKENRGFGYGHNQIFKVLGSEYHMIVNPDIEFTPMVIQKLERFLDQNPKVGQVTPKICNMDGSEQFLPKKDPTFAYVLWSKFPGLKHLRRDYTCADVIFKKPTRIDSATGCFSMVRTSLIQSLGGYDERFFMYFEDADLSRRLRKDFDVVFYPKSFVYHGWKRDNAKNMRGIWIFLTSMIKYFWKWK